MMTLTLGSKNHSSWSLRAYLAIKATGQPFNEAIIELHQPHTKAEIKKVSPSGRVPVLKDGATTVWDSLAICEYLAERFPQAKLWPQDQTARAWARSISAEMHSGFQALRAQLPMQCHGADKSKLKQIDPDCEADIARIKQIWSDSLHRFGKTGGWLCGDYSIADCMYAPVVIRFKTYGVELPKSLATYVEQVWNHPPMLEWITAAG